MGQSGNLTVLPATRQMPTLSDAIGSLSDTISGRRKAQQDANQAQVKARADSLLQMAKNLTPDQYREVRMKVIAGDPAVAPYLPDVPQYTPSAEENFKNQFTTKATSALDTMPQGAMQQGAYQMGTGAAMPSDTVQLTNAQDVTGNPDKWSAAVQERQAIGDKRSLDANQQRQGTEFQQKFQSIDLPESKAKIGAEQALATDRYASAGKTKAETAGLNQTNAALSVTPTAGGAVGDLAGASPIVKALIERRYDPAMMRRWKPEQQAQIIAEVQKYDPQFSMADYPTQVATKKSFSSGPYSQNVAAINTLIGHVGTMKNAFTALNNDSIPALNAAGNWAGRQFGNTNVQGALGAFTTAADAVANEAAKAFKGGGVAAQQEIMEWRKNVNPSMAPAEFEGSVRSLFQLLGSRLAQIDETYKTGVGRTRDFKILSPKAEKTLKDFGLNPEDLESGAPAPAAGAAPAAGGARMSKTQTNTATGQKRTVYSDDGGQTWHP